MIVFETPGHLDLNAVRLMGVSVKGGDNPIGYFGTGLKYAVAVILRLNGKFRIRIDQHVHEFGTTQVALRGAEFRVVTLDGQPLGFTTELGKNWSAANAYRELHSNTKDEGGAIYVGDAPYLHKSNTYIEVEQEEVEQAHLRRGNIFLETEPLYENDALSIHPGLSRRVFYRGVAVSELPTPSRYTYNLKQRVELTEDRTAKYAYALRIDIACGIARCTDRDILHNVLAEAEGFYEAEFSFPPALPCSEEFDQACEDLCASLNMRANRSARERAWQAKRDRLSPDASVELTPIERAKLDRATAPLRRVLGEERFGRYPIVVVDSLGTGVLGLAKDKKIVLARGAFARGTREVAATLFEEYAHLDSGHVDESREFQNYLIDQFLTVTETAIGEPL